MSEPRPSSRAARRRAARESVRQGEPPASGRSRWGFRVLWALLILCVPVVWVVARSSEPDGVPTYRVSVVRSHPHDPRAYCQGLVYDGGVLFESTGKYGQSELRRVRLQDGEVLARRPLPEDLFGEGLTLFDGRLVQLTWRAGRALVSDPRSLALVGELEYEGEGWGLTHDGSSLILSDGTSALRFLDPGTLQVKRRLRVTAEGVPVEKLNELEYIRGEVWANIWQSDRIARIDPGNGKVKSFLDLAGLKPADSHGDPDNVLNGIAYDAKGDRVFVTGKRWSRLFEIRVKE